MTTATPQQVITGTIYASERAEDIDYKISFECVSLWSEDGAHILLPGYEVHDLVTAGDEVVDLEDDDNCITVEIEQLRELAAKL